MGIEFELKYTATPAQLQAVAAAFPAEQTDYQMQTSYYDTPAGDFSARRCTLRRRMENEASVCTLKLPAAGQARQEFEVLDGDIHSALPVLCQLAQQQELEKLAQAGLVQVCGARFHRVARTLTLENCCVELAMDEGVLLGADRQLPLCELEIELKSGDPQAAVAFADALAERFDLQPESKSKFRRALDLAKEE